MRGAWRLARVMGIDIAIDPSWFIIAFLIIYALGFVQFPHELHPRAFRPGVDLLSITLAVITCLLLFASVLAHELSHSWMANQRGIPVSRITLFIFGGVAQISREPDRPMSEFLIAIMGPLMSVALAAVFGGAWLWLRIIDSASLLGASLTPLTLVCGMLFQTNGSLALFNLAPGFPLDGGRVLRAVLWSASHDLRNATRWASRAGQFIALMLVGSSVLLYLVGFGLSGIWNAVIGLFLWTAARDGYRQTMLIESLRSVSVGQLMTRGVMSIHPDLSVLEFVDQMLLHRREETFVVSDGATVLGIVTIDRIRRVPREEWKERRVRDVMTPIHDIACVSSNVSAADALAKLSGTDSVEMPVIDSGEVVGLLGQREITRFLRLKGVI